MEIRRRFVHKERMTAIQSNVAAEAQTDPVEPLDRSELLDTLERIRAEILEVENQAQPLIEGAQSEWRQSARNLLHYIALRRRDIRVLQEELVPRGLSSLGRCEAFVLANVEAVIHHLRGEGSPGSEYCPSSDVPCDFSKGRELLRQNTERLFGGAREGSEPLVMVTMSTQAASDGALVRDLLAAGMSVMRINCAHDSQSEWEAMINHLRRAEAELGKSCRIAMDLGGPKIRTGSIEPGPRVVSWKPHRDAFGQVTAPARIWISPSDQQVPPPDCDYCINVKDEWWRTLRVGDRVRFEDTSGRKRRLRVVAVDRGGVCCETNKTAHVSPATRVRISRKSNATSKLDFIAEGGFGTIPPRQQKCVLRRGDRLRITGDHQPGRSAELDPQGNLVSHATIGCTLPGILKDVHLNHRVLLDDGKIAGVVVEANEDSLLVEITRAGDRGQRLQADKGINFPDSDLQLPALTEKDISDLEFVARSADIVDLSFVRRTEDIQLLHEHLARLDRRDLGIVLKIETRHAFDNLPLLLLEATRFTRAIGVMIARGDLAVECGWERMAEVQEEILCICEAAHVPVIWATQVLEGLAKTGLPSRAEVSDAGMGVRAECVMLNKGPNIVETVKSLNDILTRMHSHLAKKRSTFRRLGVADRLFDPPH